MKSCTIVRDASTDEGTPGFLSTDDGTLTLRSLELPWKDNQPDVSCIPVGDYDATWDWSPHLNRFCYHLADSETGRVAIRIHSGNFAGDVSKGFQSDVEGCILLGRSYSLGTNKEGKKQHGVFSSQDALVAFNQWGNKEPIKVHIMEAQNGVRT